MRRFIWLLIAALLIALAAPSIAHAMGMSVPMLQTGDETLDLAIRALGIALLGFLTYWITEGLKLIFPGLGGVAVEFAAFLTTVAMSWLLGVITHIPFTFYPLLTQILLLLATWLTAHGIKRFEKKYMAALAARG